MIRLYTDAAVKGNPGPAGVGVLFLTDNGQNQLTFPLKDTWNNHHAEFQAVVLGLQTLIDNGLTEEMVFFHTDSHIVAQSIDKEYVKDKNAKPYLEQILKLIDQFPIVTTTWIPQAKNKGADNLARQALQQAIKMK